MVPHATIGRTGITETYSTSLRHRCGPDRSPGTSVPTTRLDPQQDRNPGPGFMATIENNLNHAIKHSHNHPSRSDRFFHR